MKLRTPLPGCLILFPGEEKTPLLHRQFHSSIEEGRNHDSQAYIDVKPLQDSRQGIKLLSSATSLGSENFPTF